VKRVFVEAILVAVIGAVLALAANYASPRGIRDLTHDYFGETKPKPPVETSNGAPEDQVRLKVEQAGLRLADSNQVAQFFHDPRFEQDGVVFLDARDHEHYEAGHIPGAYEFDYFHYEKYLESIIPLCEKAEVILVYCNGGDCEDSLHAATWLTDDAKVPKEKVWVYGGGITEWQVNRQTIETGARNSGTPATK
jgi:rhodanese-related sulfurtransferase